jgi:hypothetical protein
LLSAGNSLAILEISSLLFIYLRQRGDKPKTHGRSLFGSTVIVAITFSRVHETYTS